MQPDILGAAVTDFLLEKTNASNISILVRDAAKAEGFRAKGVTIHVGDYDNSEALLKAFEGVDKVYLVSGLAHNRGEQHENVINAAKEAGVKQILYTSFQRKTEATDSPIGFISESHLYTEKVLKASGVDLHDFTTRFICGCDSNVCRRTSASKQNHLFAGR